MRSFLPAEELSLALAQPHPYVLVLSLGFSPLQSCFEVGLVYKYLETQLKWSPAYHLQREAQEVVA